MLTSILTIGYGGRSITDLVTILKREQTQFLIDVRSNPRSKFNPDFSGECLSEKVRISGIRYVFMGDSLGGRPPDPSCYQHGHVVYELVQEKRFFKAGIDRLLRASAKGIRVCLLCSELLPENCHRSKLIGVSLAERGIKVTHLGSQGEPLSQDEVVAKLQAAQTEMFGNSFRSRKAYRPSTRQPIPEH